MEGKLTKREELNGSFKIKDKSQVVDKKARNLVPLFPNK